MPILEDDEADMSMLEDLKYEMDDLVEDLRGSRDAGTAAKSEPTNQARINAFRARLARLDATYQKFQDKAVAARRFATQPTEKTNLDELRRTGRRLYYETLALDSSIISPAPPVPPNASLVERDPTAVLPRLPAFKLPTINLPTFDGNLTKWAVFKDTFQALVHNNEDLANIQKYHYLRSSLQGGALQAIAIIPLTDLEYPQAWNALLQKYDNKRLQAANHLTTIFNFKPLTKVNLATIRNLTDAALEGVTAFQNLALEDESGFILTTFILRLLTPQLRERFDATLEAADEIPTLTQLKDFIHRLSLNLQTESLTSGSSTTSNLNASTTHANLRHGANRVLYSAEQTPTTAERTCVLCKENHLLFHCSRFKQMNPNERFNFSKTKKLCFNCLSPMHVTKQCKSSRSCTHCGRRHHTLVHLSSAPTKTKQHSNSEQQTKVGKPDSAPGMSKSNVSNEATHTVLTTAVQNYTNVLLGTARAYIKDSCGTSHMIRLVVDCGAQRSFITSTCAKRLRLPKSQNPHRLCGFGEALIEDGKHQVQCRLSSIFSDSEALETNAVVITRICGQVPTMSIADDVIREFSGLRLADPEFWKPHQVDFLLGADLFPRILLGTTIRDDIAPAAIQTIFGWVIMGPVTSEEPPHPLTTLLVNSPRIEQLNKFVHKFWEVEEVVSHKIENPDDAECEAHFAETHQRDSTGRYIVRLPFRVTPPDLSESRTIAVHRFYKLEGKLGKNPNLKDAYTQLFKEQLEKDYLSKATLPGKYFFPHHGVFKDGIPAKLRIVYDASCATKNGSLNDYLRTGPKLQRDIRDVLLGFRLYKYALAADICQMFSQIIVHSEDRRYQHFMFRSNPQDAITEYEHKRLPFGLSCSPFIAIRVLQQLIIDEGSKYPRAADVLKTDVYVDDILTGAENLKEAQDLQRNLISLLDKGRFQLKKWSSNDPSLIEQVEGERPKVVSLSDSEDSVVKILGLQWDPAHDCLSYCVQTQDFVPTKRGIMSIIARMYDPLGYLAPVIFQAKVILQELWKNEYDWDTKISPRIEAAWKTFHDELGALKEIQIPRCIPHRDACRNDILGFADGSSDGFAAVVYLRSEDASGHVRTALICAKTKLAPLKPLTIPRLELSAALLLARVVSSLSEFFKRFEIHDTFLFSDSMTTLYWIAYPAYRLKVFVANRVSQIQNLTENYKWLHVSSADNAADVASRGIPPTALPKRSDWWNGPKWISLPIKDWPVGSVPRTTEIELPETKPQAVLLTGEKPLSSVVTWINRFSSMDKLIRTMAYVQRFISNLKINPSQRLKGYLQITEIRRAKTIIILATQKNGLTTADTTVLESLSAFTDSAGILRVGGRLSNAPLPNESKHPIVLPRKGHFVELLIDHLHLVNLHAGPQLLHFIIRQKFWIISARRLIRSRVQRCLTCRRTRLKGFTTYMSDLPPTRFEQGRPFLNVGVDFAGPFPTRESKRRKSVIGKAYLAVFVCFSTKAIHIELVSDLTTEAFLASLDRFIARRGLPTQIFSDNGTNFVGAKRNIQELQDWLIKKSHQEAITSHLAAREIRWRMIPPRAPHFGGLWEAGVKSIKGHLTRVVGTQTLTFEELNTLACRIEALLNSRPLYPLSSDADSYDVLSPGHFLIGAPVISQPEDELEEVQPNRLSRWQLLQQFIQQIWKRWRLEYLHHLQQRVKWTSGDAVKEGTLVLIKDSAQPLDWKRGRIIKCLPGQDGVVRVVQVKTQTGTYLRAVTSLAPLLPQTDCPNLDNATSTTPQSET